MTSQLRLRAIAAGAVRRTVVPPAAAPPTAAQRLPPAPVASVATRAAMRIIQASIDALHSDDTALVTQSNDTAPVAKSDEPEARRPAKRSRLDSTPSLVAPVNAVPAARDGHTKIYIYDKEMIRATITRIKIVYRCCYYRSQACQAKLEFYASLMDYDFENMIPHTCTPPSHTLPAPSESSRTLVVEAAMQREVDRLATSTADTPQAIWDAVSAQFYNRADDIVVRGLSKAQVTKRVHRTRAQHFGSDVHGRVEVPPLSRAKRTSQNFFQFHHVWSNKSLKTEHQIDRVIGWANPALLSLLRYSKIKVFIDGAFRCVPTNFRQCIVVMVYDQVTKLYVPVCYVLAASKTYDAYWNVLQYVCDAVGQRLEPEQLSAMLSRL